MAGGPLMPTGNPVVDFFKVVGTAIINYFKKKPLTATFRVIMGVNAYKSYQAQKALKNKGPELLLTKYGTGGGMPVLYGIRRVGGTVVFMDTAEEQRELFVVYAFCAGESESIADLRIDNRSITDRSVYRDGYLLKSDKANNLYGSGATHGTPGAEIANILGSAGGSVDNPRMVFNLHHGADDQTADPMLTGIFDGTNADTVWTSNHRLRGITYIATNYEFDNKGMFQGIPNLTATIKGRKVYDPRLDSTQTGGSGSHRSNDSSTWEWSSNPALCLLDYLTNDDYGKGLAYSEIDIASFMDSADDCDVDIETVNHGSSVVVNEADATSDEVILADQAIYHSVKIGQNLAFSSGGTDYFSGRVIAKYNPRIRELGDTYASDVYVLRLEDDSVTTAITSPVTGTLTETQKRFECNAVIDTKETVLENAQDLIRNMRGIFTYTNGQYSLKIEGTETPVLTLDEDDILDAGLELTVSNKETKFNRVEVEFYNAQKNYEADTVVFDHTPDAPNEDDHTYDDGGENLETRAIFPFVTNQRIAYNHAKAILRRSRAQKTISFVATPKVLKAKVGDVVSITNSNLDLSAEQYRITQMQIQPDLNIAVTAIEYQGDIYGWNSAPDEDIKTPRGEVDPYRVEKPTGLNFTEKSGQTPAFLSWTDANTYPAYQYRVKVFDDVNQTGNAIREAVVQEPKFDLPEIPKGTGYSASVTAINTTNNESDEEVLNDFDVTVDTVVNQDIADSAVDTEEINQGAIGGMKFTETKAYYGTGTFDSADTPFYVDTSSNFSLGEKLTFDGTTLTIDGDGSFSGDISSATGTISNSITIGTGDDVFKASASGIQLGDATFADAPFSVDMQGNAIAESLKLASGGTTLTAFNTFNPDFPVDGLVHYFPLNGFSDPNDTTPADVEDVVGGITGVVSGSNGSFGEDSPNGQAYVNGATTGITLLNNATANTWQSTTGDYTVSLWFKSTTTSGDTSSRIIGRDASDFWSIALDQSQSGDQNLILYTDGENPVTFDGASVNEWHHVALVVNGTTSAKLYLDGELKGTDTDINYVSSSRPVVLGCNTESSINTASSVFLGKFSDVRFYTKAITDKQVQSLYMNPAGGLPAKLDGNLFIDGTITADKINVNNLQALSSDLGSITAGSLNINSGQFVVTSAGAMTAQSATITGSVTSTSGTIGGFTLGSNFLTAGSDTSRIKLSTADGIHMGNDVFANAPFNVTKGGQVTATDLILKKGNVTYFDSTDGFSAEAIAQIASSLNTRVQTFAFSSENNTDFATIETTEDSQDIKLVVRANASNLRGDGTSEALAIAEIPDNLTIKIEFDDNSSFTSPTTIGSLQTFNASTDGTPLSSEYEIETLDLSELGGDFSAFVLGNQGAVNTSGDIVYTVSSYTVATAGTYYFRVIYDTTDTSYNATNDPESLTRSLEIEDLSGSGFLISNGSSGAQTSDAVTLTGTQTITGAKTFSATTTFSGNVNISGDLSVTGTTTTIDTATLNVEDKNITLNYSTGDSSASADGAGITIQDAVNSTTDATILWDATSDNFEISHSLRGNDDVKIRLGNNNDLQIYHDGSHSYISDSGTGSLRVTTDAFRVRNVANNASIITGLDGGGVFLYHNGNEKLETTSNGIEVSGDISLPNATSTIDFGSTGEGGPHGLNFIDDGGSTVFRVFYRTSPETLTFENAGETARHTFDLDGDYTAERNITAKGSLDITGAVDIHDIFRMEGGSANPIAFRGTGTDTNHRNFAYESSDHHYVTNRHTNGDLVLMSNNGTGGGETARITLQGGSGTQDIDITNANLDLNSNNINNAGTVTATSFSGDGSGLTNLTTTTINSNADNRIITGSGTADTLNAEANLTYDGSSLDVVSALMLNRGTSGNNTYGLIQNHDYFHEIVLRGYPTNNSTGYSQDNVTSFNQYSGDFRFYLKDTSNLTLHQQFTSSGIDTKVGGFLINGTTVINSSKNLTNIGTYSGSGDMTISKSGTPTLTVETSATSGEDALIQIRGARTSSSVNDIAKIKFDNKTSSAYTLAEITARDPSGSHTLGRGSLIFRTSAGGTLSDALLINQDKSATFYDNVTLSGGALTVTSDSDNVFRNSTDQDLKFTFVTNNTSDFAQLILDGKDGGSEKFLIGYGSTHSSTPNMLALKSNDSSAGSIGFFTAGQERGRFDVNGNLGIGTINPDLKLHVAHSGTNNGLLLEHTSQASGYQYLLNARQNEGLIFQRWANGSFSANVMTLDYSGNVLVGKTSADNGATVGIEMTTTDKLYVTDSASSPLIANRLASDGNVIVVQKDGTSVGTLAARISDLVIGNNDVGLRFSDGGDSILPAQSGSTGDRDNAIDLGASGARFKNAYLGGSLYAEGTVRIGSSSSAGLLIVSETNDTFPTIASSTKAIFASDNTTAYDAGISIIAPDDVSINFGDYNNEDAGAIIYKNSDDSMRFNTATGERMVISSSGGLSGVTTLVTNNFIRVGNGQIYGRDMLRIQTSANTQDRGISFQNSGNAFSNSIFAENVGGNDARLVFTGGNSSTTITSLSRDFMINNQSGGGGVSGDIHARGDVVAFSSTVSSDERLKYDIEDIKNPLDIIQSLKGRHFKWKKNDQQSSGVIAQEVEQSEMSFLVSDKVDIENPDETIKRVKYDGFIGVLIEAIKELKAEIEELKKQ